jgi:hypothetical protein
MPKTAQEADANERASYRTGPNVDNGLEPGAVTVDPHTAAGIAAAAARDANGANTTMTDDGVAIVEPAEGSSYNDDPKVKEASAVADKDAPAVDKQSAAAKAKTPNTIGNTPDDIKADPKADVQ